MKKTPLLAAMLAGLPFAALAQGSVTAYGMLDVSVESFRYSATPGHPSTHLTTLASDTSRLGFRGVEDLGDGLRAYFKLETGFGADNGALTAATVFWSREAYLGLGDAKLGSIQAGSQYTPALWMSIKADPFTRFGLAGQYTLLQGLRGYQLKYDNAVQYISPVVGGVQGRLMVAAGEGAVTGASYSGSLDYTQGPLYVGAVLDQVKTTAASVGLTGSPVNSRTLSLAASYDFKVVKLQGWAQTNRIDSLPKVNGYLIGATIPLGVQDEIRTSYAHRSAPNADASLFAVGYYHLLSKRTTLYANLGRLTNAASTAFRMGPALGDQAALGLPFAGQDTTGLQLGMRHWF
ncbi:porin [Pelomonas sp. KK5]|uniref:porin n=1 Tax=Pelomonas sp. KK5 TaxID=1855730 RepID=UPI00097C93DC|nr:porin [Pelomonas sp. KK5]